MAGIETITPRKAPAPRRLTVKGASVILGLLLLLLAAPRLSSEFTLLLARSADVESLDLAALHARASQLEASPETASFSRALAQASQLRLAAARRQQAATSGALADLQQGIEDQQRALLRAPADAYGWLRLAHAAFATGRLLEAARAWRLSQVTAPFDPELMAARTEAGFALWRYMDVEARDAMRDALLKHRAWNADDLAATVQRFGAHAILSQSLRRDTEALLDIEGRIRRRMGLT